MSLPYRKQSTSSYSSSSLSLIEVCPFAILEIPLTHGVTLVHHDNRDFSILPDHQPKGQSFDLQTVLGGVHPAVSRFLLDHRHTDSVICSLAG